MHRMYTQVVLHESCSEEFSEIYDIKSFKNVYV